MRQNTFINFDRATSHGEGKTLNWKPEESCSREFATYCVLFFCYQNKKKPIETIYKHMQSCMFKLLCFKVPISFTCEANPVELIHLLVLKCKLS